MITVPFASKYVCTGGQRFYDEERLRIITRNMIREKEDYYFRHKSRWFSSTKEYVKVQIGSDSTVTRTYAVACIVLKEGL